MASATAAAESAIHVDVCANISLCGVIIVDIWCKLCNSSIPGVTILAAVLDLEEVCAGGANAAPIGRAAANVKNVIHFIAKPSIFKKLRNSCPGFSH
mmetsp:Transcript_31660/g.67036  ORF Transcript_31660/g.67036 Transcript_31660/m.67036 type:complete len:97 (+) Transcript_31660:1278-1568(+)